ncbi:MAG: hypothetical protein ACOYOV_16365, partial [Bacteroidales bacterium]
MENTKLSRKALYDLVWSISIPEISMRYDISGSIVRKICKDVMIPLPENGYLMKKKYGKPVDIITLNDEYKGDDLLDFQPYILEEINTYKSLLKAKQKEIETDKRISLKVPAKLSNPDILIQKYIELQEEKKKNKNWYQKKEYENRIFLNVSEGLKNRALLFLDTLFKAIRIRGHKINITFKYIVFIIENEEFEVSIREKKERIKVKKDKYSWNTYEHRQTGILIFGIKGPHGKDWKEGSEKLEDQLSKIIAYLELEGKRNKKRSDEIHEYWAEVDRHKRIELEIKLNKEKELSKFKVLLQDAKRWKKSMMLKEYI